MSNYNMLLDLDFLQDGADKVKESIKLLNGRFEEKLKNPENYLIKTEIQSVLEVIDRVWEAAVGYLSMLDKSSTYTEHGNYDGAVIQKAKDIADQFIWESFPPGTPLAYEFEGRLNEIVDFIEKFSPLVKNEFARERFAMGIPELRMIIKNQDLNIIKFIENGVLADEKFSERIEFILIHKIDFFNSENYEKFLKRTIDEQGKETNEKLQKHLFDLNVELAEYKAEYELHVREKLENVRTGIENTEKKNESLIKKLNAYNSLLSTATQHEVAKHYAKKSKQEMATYYFFTTLSFIIIFGSIYFAWESLTNYYYSFIDPIGFKAITSSLTDTQISELQNNAKYFLILRLVLSVILFSTIIYTARLAKNAYLHWRHSENMKLKLTSLGLFISNLDEDVQKQIHKDLVPDYFGKDAGELDNNNEKFKDIPNNVSALAVKAIEQSTTLISKNESNNQTTNN